VYAAAQLDKVWLADVHFVENPDYVPNSDIRYFVNSTVEVEDFHRWDEEDETHAIASLAASIVWNIEGTDDQPGELPFTLEVVVRGRFVWQGVSIDQDLAESWISYNATHLLWPYLRGYVTAITAWSALPSLTIYTVMVPEEPDFGSEENAVPERESGRTSD
jgi:preprotein translocase subunit SecB